MDATDELVELEPIDDVTDENDWWLPGIDWVERIYTEAEIGMGE